MAAEGADLRTAIVATHRLVDWGGSEIVALEVAEELSRRGLKVRLFAYMASDAMREQADRARTPIETDAADVDLRETDILYSHHQVASHLYHRQMARGRLDGATPVVVCNHLSPFEPLEGPGPTVEPELADLVWCNSEETRDALLAFGDRYRETEVVPNPAPASFFVPRPALPSRLRSLLVVSNHRPDEVGAAMDLLGDRGVRSSWLGFHGERRRITPADIAAHDAVVSIGKTCQYAFASGTPVYCYDHFGGPGWITASNLDRAAACNFSGRSHPRRLDAARMAEDLVGGYPEARAFAQSIEMGPRSEWRLEGHIDRLCDVAIRSRADPGRTERVSRVLATDRFRQGLRIEGQWQDIYRRELAARDAMAAARDATEAANRALRQEVARLRNKQLGRRIRRLLGRAA